MIIKSVKFEPCEMPLADTTWRFAQGAIPVNRGYIVCLESDDGTIGYGYAQAFQQKGTIFEALLPLLERFAPLIVDTDPQDMENALTAMDKSLDGAAPVKAAFDCAMHDLAAKRLGVPLHKLLGGKVRDSIPMMRILALKSPEETAAQAVERVAEGYRYLKIKVDGDVNRDVARVKAVRKAVGDDIGLIVDANQAYTVKQAITSISRMAEYGLDIAEQPVPAADFNGLKEVTRAVSVAVEADESASSVEAILTLVANRVVDSVNLKIPPLGGLRNTLAAARICEAANMPCRLGASFCSQILQAQAMHLAAALPKIGYACELSEFIHFQNDPFSGLTIRDGEMMVSDAAGSGVTFQL